MSDRLTLRDYWDYRATVWQEYDVPLIPSTEELEFNKRYLVPGGDTLVLGATRELCSLAREISGNVLSVDFSAGVIEVLKQDGVQYQNSDWFEFFENTDQKFDNIITDGGFICLEYPDKWQKLSDYIHDHLKSRGVFIARIYISTENLPKDSYDNPNLERFVTSIGIATAEINWMVHPKHSDYDNYDLHYAFPPESELTKVFGSFKQIDRMIPSYEEGEHFPSFAFQKQ